MQGHVAGVASLWRHGSDSRSFCAAAPSHLLGRADTERRAATCGGFRGLEKAQEGCPAHEVSHGCTPEPPTSQAAVGGGNIRQTFESTEAEAELNWQAMSPGAARTPPSSGKKCKQQAEPGLAYFPEAPTAAAPETSKDMLGPLEFVIKQADQVAREGRTQALTPGAQTILRLWETFCNKAKQDIPEQVTKLEGESKAAFLKRAEELTKRAQDLKPRILSELPVAESLSCDTSAEPEAKPQPEEPDFSWTHPRSRTRSSRHASRERRRPKLPNKKEKTTRGWPFACRECGQLHSEAGDSLEAKPRNVPRPMPLWRRNAISLSAK